MNLKRLLPAALLLVSASAFAQGGAALEPSKGVSEDAESQRAQAQEFRRQGDHLKEAEAYEKAGDLEAAAKSLFEHAQSVSHKLAQERTRMVKAGKAAPPEQERYEQVWAILDDIVERYPGTEGAGTALCEKAGRYGRLLPPEERVKLYERFVKEYPNHPMVEDAYSNWASTLNQDLKDYAQEARILENLQGLKRAGGTFSPLLATNASGAYQSVGDYTNARRVLLETIDAIEAGNLKYEGYMSTSPERAYVELDTPAKRKAAVRDLEKRIEKNDAMEAESIAVKARNAERQARIKAGQGLEAAPSATPTPLSEQEQLLRKASELSDNGANREAAKVAEQAGNREKAAEYRTRESRALWNEVRDRNPEALEKCVAILDEIAQTYGDTERGRHAIIDKAYRYKDFGDEAKYEAALREYVQEFPEGEDVSQVHMELAGIAWERGDKAEAYAMWTKVKERFETQGWYSVFAVRAMADSYLEDGEKAKAIALLNDLVAKGEAGQLRFVFIEGEMGELATLDLIDKTREEIDGLSAKEQP
ncbi:MAG: hypothetical protein IT365_01265 [Candidatus Hydrogenedentes bacterium]|nr:hypothetical protein [Candidatus Hydrogenedentota bacterium]